MKRGKFKNGNIRGVIEGDADAIFNQITKGAKVKPSGAREINGVHITLHEPSKGNPFPTIEINKAGVIYKIRVIPKWDGTTIR